MSKTPTPAALPADIAALSFEQALAELDRIVQQLEGGKVELEKSIEIYERGSLLRRHCEAKLRAAEERVEQIVSGPEGVASQPAKYE
jgi:exodeoxyribonuclease VII small subunit